MLGRDKEMQLARRMRTDIPRVWSPESFFEEVDRWFDDLRGGFGNRSWSPVLWPGRRFPMTSVRYPAVDVRDTGKEVVVTAELPGVNKEDVEIHVTSDGLELRAETKTESEQEEEGYAYRERGYRSFDRRLTLPAKVVPGEAKASLADGVLEVRMPKSEPTPETKPVKVKVR